MINEVISMNGYGIYVWSAFSFTLISFGVLYTVIKFQLVKEKNKFDAKYLTLTSDKKIILSLTFLPTMCTEVKFLK